MTNGFVIKTTGNTVDKEALQEISQEDTGFHPGQLVVIEQGYTKKTLSLSKVKKVSAKNQQVLLENGLRFLSPYRRIGGSFEPVHLVPATPELIEKVYMQDVVSYLRGVKWEMLNSDNLRNVINVLKDVFPDTPKEM